MRTILTVSWVLTLCAAGPLAAQQHPGAGPGGDRHAEHMAQMMEADRVLEQKLAAADSLQGAAKVDALAAVVRELVAQRRAMHARMGAGMGGMMGPRQDSTGKGPGQFQRPCPGT